MLFRSEGENGKYLFVMNFSGKPAEVNLPEGIDALTGEKTVGKTCLKVNGVAIVKI